jgi:hypothetical protein
MTLSFFVEKRVIGNNDETIKKCFDQEDIKFPFLTTLWSTKTTYHFLTKKKPAPSSLPEFDPGILMCRSE